MNALSRMLQRYTVQESKKIQRTCIPAFEAFNANFIYYNHITLDGRFVTIGSHPDWMHEYYSTAFVADNPFFCSPHYLQQGIVPFQESGSPNIIETCQVAKNKYKLNLKYALFRKTSKGCSQFGISFLDHPDLNTIRSLNEISTLERYFDFFETELSSLLRKALEDPVNLIETRGNGFYEKPNFNNMRIDREKKIGLLKILSPLSTHIFSKTLTPRERECIDLLLKDFSYKEIAHSLNLSSRTVEFYMNNIRKKFGYIYQSDLKRTIRLMKDLELN